MGRLYLLAGEAHAGIRKRASERLRAAGEIGLIDIAEIGLKNEKKLSALLFACDGLVLVGNYRDDSLSMECLRLASRLSLEIIGEEDILAVGRCPPSSSYMLTDT